ncbi:MAG: STN domain-containing protein [Planctomycetes bacterium]|nr:STN domain-containing protein [Planctomycetota bacterium]
MSMRILAGVLALSLGACGWAGEDAEAAAEPALAPNARIAKALGTKLEALDEQEHTLSEMLALFAKLSGENFILDASLPKSVGGTRVTVKVKPGATVLDAFSVCLALTGLRYTILDGAVFVSTEGKLSDRLLTAQGLAQEVESPRTREPLSVGEAVVRSRPFDPYQDDFVQARDFIAHDPWRHWEAPRHNPRTGLTDYPGPPVWIEDPDIGHPRFRFTGTPYFLKPEYLALEMEKHELREEQDRRAQQQRQEQARALAAVLQMLKDNPDLTAKQIMEKMGKEEP